jgi:pyruvate/2-oxoglutarate dehydrogenase complex dihydrolipoamide dehydrogenase (E3) component
MKRRTDYDLCVIGGGAAGLVTAAGAATLGAKVILIDKAKLGGDCLYHGCVPSKTLIHSANTAHTIRHAHRFGLKAHHEAIDQALIRHRIADVIKHIEPNDSPERFRALGVEVVQGEATFTNEDTVEVNRRGIKARKFVIATGSKPVIPGLEGLADIDYFTNETIFSTNETIESLVIIGAGPIGCELAQSYQRLGVNVSLVSRNTLLPREDADMAEIVKQQFIVDGVDLHLTAHITKVEKTASGIRLQIDGEKQQSERRWLEASHLLIATGRHLDFSSLNLQQAGIEISQGRLVLDERLRTTNQKVFACGDCAGPYQFTHMAEHQASVVLQNALFHLPIKAKTQGVPWCTFTSPELARVGLSEQQARQQSIKHKVYSFPFSEIDRAICDGDTVGMAKVIVSSRGKVLGAAIVGPHAGELIAEFSLAISQGLKLSALSKAIHIYPTLAQINRRVADQQLKAALRPVKKRLIKLVFGLRGKL